MLYFTLILSRCRELHETNNGIRTIIFGIALSPNQDSTYFFHHSWLATDSHDSHRVTMEYRLLPKRCKVFFSILAQTVLNWTNFWLKSRISLSLCAGRSRRIKSANFQKLKGESGDIAVLQYYPGTSQHGISSSANWIWLNFAILHIAT